MLEKEIIEALQRNLPFQGIRGVRIRGLEFQPRKGLFDVVFRVESGPNAVLVYGEIKNNCSPKMVQEIAPWLARLKAVEQDTAFAIICPTLSQAAQDICIENNVDFIDLAGNVSINVPGNKFVLQRLGQKKPRLAGRPKYQNPFGGRSSRVLRVLLQNPKEWRLTEVGEELALESQRNEILKEIRFWTKTTEEMLQQPSGNSKAAIVKEGFEISLGSISKVLKNLEEDLLVRRRNSSIAVPEPGRLLLAWAQKYKERYRWNLRRSFKCPNPFGMDLQKINISLADLLGSQAYAFTGVAAALLTAPFVEVATIDVFIADDGQEKWNLRNRLKWPLTTADTVEMGLRPEFGTGPDLRVIYPYDLGVFMYSSRVDGIPVVSNIQVFLDLFSRGGRDLKQAEYLLEEAIEPKWGKT